MQNEAFDWEGQGEVQSEAFDWGGGNDAAAGGVAADQAGSHVLSSIEQAISS